jgi:ABC-type Na+ efflux pump permease subunit
MNPRRSRTFKVVGWLLVAPLVAALINAVSLFADTNPNEETESIERVGAAILVLIAFLLAVGGLTLIRRASRPSQADDANTTD